LISELEHYSIFNTMHMLRSHGFEVELIPATKGGLITKEALLGKLRDDTLLVSVMHANGEIGVINPIKELAEIAHSKGALFHTDATASAGLLPIDFDDLNLDALTLSAHNFYGSKGVGALIVKDQVTLKSRIFGGWQEMGLRSGTENVPGIIGMGKASELAKAELPALSEKLTVLGDLLWKRLEEKIKFIHFTGQKSPRLPGHVSYWIEHVEGESVILMLNMNGVMCASGSACSSNLKGEDEDDLVASHVLEAVGVPTDICAGSVTFSLGKSNNEEQIEKTVEALVKVVDRLLMMSPSYADFLKNGETK